MTDTDRQSKMEIDYSSVVDQKLKECDEIMQVRLDSLDDEASFVSLRFVH